MATPANTTRLTALASLFLLVISTTTPAQQTLNPNTGPVNLPTQRIAPPPSTTSQIPDPANLMGERVSPPALADTLPINHGVPALAQLLLKLRTRASLMMIVAHPDDEDSGMLTYESRGQGARVAMLTLNRGEGGQNLMSSDFNDALGLIRTQELLAEDRFSGTDQFFGSVIDFGFSKTREEALQQWGHDRVLYDAVRAVRLYRPLVLTSVFIGGVTDGHGQHQVAGQINQEVFAAAADPTRFPEMGLPPWAPAKVFARVPFFRVSKEGMYDYATGQTAPPRFYNYLTKQWTTTEPPANVLIPEGQSSTALGMDGQSYGQFARKGLILQKSQIGENVRLGRPGPGDVAYTQYATRIGCPTIAEGAAEGYRGDTPFCSPPPPAAQPDQSFFTGIDTTLPGIATLAPHAPTLRATLQTIDDQIVKAQKLFTPDHPELTAPPLREALKALDTLLIVTTGDPTLPTLEKYNVLHELRIKRVQLNDALVLALGITLQPMPKPARAGQVAAYTTADPSAYANATLHNNGPEPLTVLRLDPIAADDDTTHQPQRPLPPGGTVFAESTIPYRTAPPPTRPYFSRPSIEQPFYDIADPNLRNAPVTPYPLVASAIVEDQGVPLELRAIVPDPMTAAITSGGPSTSSNVPIPQPAVIVPPVSISLGRTSPGQTPAAQSANSAGILPLDTNTFSLGATLAVDAAQGSTRISPQNIPITLHVASLWHVSEPTYNPNVQPLLERFTITPGPLRTGQTYTTTATATFHQHEYTESYRPAGYPGLTYTNIYTPATYKATAVDVETARDLKIAYLPGTGDDVPAYLPNLGVTPTILTPSDLNPATLAHFDEVILGVRAYAVHPELANCPALLSYAASGGVVIVQYNTAKYGDPQSPYPIDVPGDSAHNVVEEAQPVQILDIKAPLLNWPNQITAKDFTGWVEELGHGFAATWDPRFEPLTETHDPDQDPQRGGLLYARTGRGAYVYVAYALYRQLPEGVPGAYRLFANLLSLPRNLEAGIQPLTR
jgi:LmbE family N-acetylglucosaminyl deacetylase